MGDARPHQGNGHPLSGISLAIIRARGIALTRRMLLGESFPCLCGPCSSRSSTPTCMMWSLSRRATTSSSHPCCPRPPSAPSSSGALCDGGMRLQEGGVMSRADRRHSQIKVGPLGGHELAAGRGGSVVHVRRLATFPPHRLLLACRPPSCPLALLPYPLPQLPPPYPPPRPPSRLLPADPSWSRSAPPTSSAPTWRQTATCWWGGRRGVGGDGRAGDTKVWGVAIGCDVGRRRLPPLIGLAFRKTPGRSEAAVGGARGGGAWMREGRLDRGRVYS